MKYSPFIAALVLILFVGWNPSIAHAVYVSDGTCAEITYTSEGTPIWNPATDGGTCTSNGSGGTSSSSPTASLTVTPDAIVSGYSALLTWTSTHSDQCSSPDFVTNGNTSNGVGVSVGPLVPTTYHLACTGNSETASSSVVLNVIPAKSCYLPSDGVIPITAIYGSVTGHSDDSGSGCSCGGSGSSCPMQCSGACNNYIPTITLYTPMCCSGAGGFALNGNSVVGIQCTQPTAAVDFTAGKISPTSIRLNATTTLQSTITNIGTASSTAGFTVLFQQATDSTGSNPVSIGTGSSVALDINATSTAQLAYKFTSTGTKYIRACADKSSSSDSGTVYELNETNNCGVWTAVQVKAPDLISSGVAVYQNSNSYTLVARVQNTGSISSGTSFYNLFQKTTSVNGSGVATASVTDIGFISTSTLGTGLSSDITLNNATVADGDWVRICADKKSASDVGKIAESNEDNNCGSWAQIKSSATCSLTASPSLILTGNSSTLKWETKNMKSASIDQGVGEVTPVSGGSKLVTPSTTTTYTLTCTDNNNNIQTSQADVTVSKGTDQSACDVQVDPPSLSNAGGSVNVSWTSTSTVSCSLTEIVPAASNDKTTGKSSTKTGSTGSFADILRSSAYTVHNADGSTNDLDEPYTASFELSCKLVSGKDCVKNKYVTVGGSGSTCSPTIAISANPNRVQKGSNTTLNWSVTSMGPEGCIISNHETGEVLDLVSTADGPIDPGSVEDTTCTDKSGSSKATNIVTQTEYDMRCGSTATSTVVNIVPKFSNF